MSALAAFRSSIHRSVALAFTGGFLLALVVLTSAGAADSPTSLCSYGGIRYVGTTSQKKTVCFTLTTRGTAMREYAYEYLDTCGSGTARALNPRGGVMPLAARTGVFVRIGPDGFFKGTVRGKTASGTFRQYDEGSIPGKGSLACDTHLVGWTAKRVG